MAPYWSETAVRAAWKAFNSASPNPMRSALEAAEAVRRAENPPVNPARVIREEWTGVKTAPAKH